MSSPMDWQATKPNVMQRNKHILETGELSDCNFLVGRHPQQQETLKGHKFILAESSCVFQTMFYGQMAEKNDPILINDVSPQAFKALLEYIYTDQLNFSSVELAFELWYCAKKYMLPFLEEECTKFIFSKLTLENVCRIYESAKLFGEPVMLEKCLHLIRTETKIVLINPSFKEIQLETLITIFDQEELDIDSEIELLFAAQRWANAECIRQNLPPNNKESLSRVIGNALTKIRFLTFSMQQFANGPANSLLLNENDVDLIIKNISSGGAIWPMPKGFSTNLRGRVIPQKQHSCEAPDKKIKWFCRRLLSTEVYGRILNVSVSSLAFKVDTERIVHIIGIEIPSQDSGGNLRYMYDEELYIELCDSDGSMLTYADCEGEKRRSSEISVMFNTPIRIIKNKVYRIQVNFINNRSCNIMPCLEEVFCGSVSFSFRCENMPQTPDNLIRTIIYTVD